jgi:hypothetical protein
MAWTIKANLVEACSCTSFCPCLFGPTKPTQEWCSFANGIEILEGSSDGVDLSGARMALSGELPGDFFGGFDKAKLYFDPSVSEDQRRELEAIFHGERGGVWGGLKDAIRSWLPSAVSTVEVNSGDSPGVKVEGAGEVTLQRTKTEDGKQATVNNAPVAAMLGEHVMDVANGSGSSWSDPDLRSWESKGHGSVTQVEWSG